jgi:hypothetical protein
MTPKQKADQLVQKFYSEVLYGNSSDYSERILRIFMIKAKNCALLTVDELLEATKRYDYTLGPKPSYNDYWLKVKYQIEKL